MEFGLIGKNLSHSYSKIIHNAIGDYSYDLCPLEPFQLDDFFKESNFKGLNVTIPYKETVMAYCHVIDHISKRIGAVNTLYFKDGKLHGTNTDYYGFLKASSLSNITYKDKKILLLGDGATSRTLIQGILDNDPKEIIQVSRKKTKNTISYDAIKEHYNSDVIVNTTPVGMYPNNGEALVDLLPFKNCSGVFDVVYNPYYTNLLLQARALGVPFSNGLSMLVLQAAKAAEFFLGHPVSVDAKLMGRLSTDRLNIALIGMPGCGKTTVGKSLATMLNKPFVDTDALICSKAGKTIPEIFQENGEEFFRNLEKLVIKEVSKESGTIISTGGGTVLSEENMKNLMGNSTIVHVSRPLELLEQKGRPLSKNLENLHKKRASLYKKYSSFFVENTATPKDTAALIIDGMKSIDNFI